VTAELESKEPAGLPAVHILLPVRDGLRYVDEQIRSIQAQTYTAWRLWVRDDGSKDGTGDRIRSLAAADDRIRLVCYHEQGIGATRAFAWLLENVAPAADYIMFCDQDDSWLPTKIEETLNLLRRTELEPGGSEGHRVPTLVHTDVKVVDAELNVIASSLWHYQGVRPQRATLNRLLIQNCVTGCTVMINRALRELAVPVPSEAVMHDWWVALVASCVGRVEQLPGATLLYRQHPSNYTGAYRHPRGLSRVIRSAREALGNGDKLRESLRVSAAQAGALLERHGNRMSPETRRLVRAYAELPAQGALSRKVRLLRLGTLRHTFVGNVGLILRA
jgi:hypothetical protein